MRFKLPGGMAARQGALAEPFSAGLHAAFQGQVRMGGHAVILGSGCIGLMALLACKASGASDITVAGVIPKRLECAMKLGATRVVNGKEKDAVKEIMELAAGAGIGKAFETAGSPVAIAQTAHVVKAGGTIVLAGMSAGPELACNFGQVMAKEARVESVFRYRNLCPRGISAIASGAAGVGSAVTRELAFDDMQKAFEAALNDKENVVKVAIRIS